MFPDVPLSEALELLARRELRSLLVVGPDQEVLGVITAGEALRHALEREGRRLQPGTVASQLMAVDVMSRSIMGISEDQDLLDAANFMVKRKERSSASSPGTQF